MMLMKPFQGDSFFRVPTFMARDFDVINRNSDKRFMTNDSPALGKTFSFAYGRNKCYKYRKKTFLVQIFSKVFALLFRTFVPLSQRSPNVFVRGSHKLLHNSPRAGHLTQCDCFEKCYILPGLRNRSRSRSQSRCRSRKESEVFGWCRSGIFYPTPTPKVQLNHFLHHTPKLGIPVEVVQFLLTLVETEISCCAP